MQFSKISFEFRSLLPGVTAAIVIAIASLFLAEHYGASAMLFALLLGMSLNFLGQEGRTVVGVQWSASTLLRLGVALLGLRITAAEIGQLGWATSAVVVSAVALTIGFGALLTRITGHERNFGLLTGGAVAICGASAALAISAVLPRHGHASRDTTFTVIGVTALSTIAMVVYPLVSHALGLSDRQAGIFLGATIHDVAQVIGAGYSVSPEAGDTATVVKLLRVAMLLPVIFLLSVMLRDGSVQAEAAGGEKMSATTSRPPLLPWFAVAFALLVVVNSTIAIPKEIGGFFNQASRFLLVTAIAAIGMKTQLKELTVLGWRPVILIVSETLFLAIFAAAAMRWIL